MRARKTIVEIVVAGLLFAFIALFYQQIILAGLIAVGRSPNCPFRLAFGSSALVAHQGQRAQSLRAGSRLIESDTDGLQLWETPLGRYWVPASSSTAFFYDLAEQDRGIYAADGHGVKMGDVVLDCGANIGVYSRTALNAGASKVIAIEPAPHNVKSLRKTFAREIEDGRVVVFPEGVWDRDDFLEMNIVDENEAANSFVLKSDKTSGTVRLPLTTVDKLVAKLNLTRVDYIKMDIEGAERRALAGAAGTLARFRPHMAICVYHLADDPKAIPAAITRARADYASSCGPCIVDQAVIKPEVYFYY